MTDPDVSSANCSFCGVIHVPQVTTPLQLGQRRQGHSGAIYKQALSPIARMRASPRIPGLLKEKNSCYIVSFRLQESQCIMKNAVSFVHKELVLRSIIHKLSISLYQEENSFLQAFILANSWWASNWIHMLHCPSTSGLVCLLEAFSITLTA